MNHICRTDLTLGSGTYKIAYATEKCKVETPKDWTSDEDPKKLCIVVFKNRINWLNPTTSTDEEREYVEFKTKLKSDPKFDYGVYKIVVAVHMVDKLTQVVNILKDYGDYFGSTQKININDRNPHTIALLEKWYGFSDDQFEIMNELKKMSELNKIGLSVVHSGRGAPPESVSQLAPMLHQIRIDTIDLKDKKIIIGTPFSPANMDEEFAKITNRTPVKILYLVEKCGMSIKALIQMVNFDRFTKIGEEIIKFIDLCVDLTHEINCDFKPENLCPQYTSDGMTIESLSLLDIDAKFYIKNDSPDFIMHAKVFMKFMIFSYIQKYSQKIFPDWGITETQVRDMLRFFYDDAYMVYRYNPLNMLWHYLVRMNPKYARDDYEFLYHDELKKYYPSADALIENFNGNISYVRPKVAVQGALSSLFPFPKFSDMGGGIKQRRRRSYKVKSRKHKKKHQSRRKTEN